MNIRWLLLTGSVLIITGCFPYENDFACRLTDNYGHCVDVQGAYKAAVTGVPTGRPLRKGERIDRASSHGDSAAKDGSTAINNYADYKQKMYREMSDLIESPTTPMLMPAKQIRTLFLPYSAHNEKTRLFMQRYVYTVVEDPKWIMGEYLYKKPELTRSMIQPAEQGKASE
jgi:conjugal transfer pilus assembly protein TraV